MCLHWLFLTKVNVPHMLFLAVYEKVAILGRDINKSNWQTENIAWKMNKMIVA